MRHSRSNSRECAVIVIIVTKRQERLALGALLAATAVLYLANITVNGMANTFYSGAAWAGTRSWKALLFGSVDPSNFITVDKPPVSQWVMSLSGRLFGFNAASLLIPEAIMGVLTVWLTYATVRRVSSALAAFVAAAALALTPVAALMFRFDNPDAVMVLLMVAAAYCTVRAAQRGSTWWLCLGGSALGFAFLAKMLEGVMCLPALLLIYLMAAPRTWLRKAVDLAAAAAVFVVSAGWYVLLTILWPASERPYLAGSTDNSFLNLAFGYNGLSRVQGRGSGKRGADAAGAGDAAHTAFGTAGAPGAGASSASGWAGASRSAHAAGGAMGGKTGLTRLFGGEFGLEISWLIPAALVALVGVIVLRRGRGRADLVRATAAGAGVWLVLDGLVLSFMGGTTHAYYTLAIAAPIAILVGLGVQEGWAARERLAGRVVVTAIVMAGVDWGIALWWSQDSSWLTPLPIVIAVLGNLAALAFLLRGRGGRASLAALVLGVVAVTASPAAFAINSDTVAHTGSSPSVNPVASKQGGRSGAAGASAIPGRNGMNGMHDRSGRTGESGQGMASGQFGGRTTKPDPALTNLLRSSHARWAAATSTTSQASILELASRTSVMGIGGFTGSDPVPTLAQFQKLVAAHEIGYYVVSAQGTGAGGGAGSRHSSTAAGDGDLPQGQHGRSGEMGGRGGTSSAITAWVKAHYTATTVGSDTVYDLSHAS